jgi:rod shape-determining protein MreC
MTNNLNLFFADVFGPILSIGQNASSEVFSPLPSNKKYVSRAEYNKLLAAYDNTRADLITEHKKFEKLARIKSGLPKPGPVLRLADVRNIQLSGAIRQIYINRGRTDDIKKGRFVLGENSLIGTVAEVTDWSAKVRLITDSNHRIKVYIWRRGKTTYITGQMIGTGTDTARISLLSREYDIKKGDIVYAADKPGLLETPVVTGRISLVKPDENNPLLWDISVKPIYDVTDLKTVAVVLPDEMAQKE